MLKPTFTILSDIYETSSVRTVEADLVIPKYCNCSATAWNRQFPSEGVFSTFRCSAPKKTGRADFSFPSNTEKVKAT